VEDDELARRRIGTTLSGRYQIEGLLGAGGMATVYRGRHRNGNRVAIKMLHPQLAMMREVAARFLKEGYVANAVDHPGTVRVLDDDRADDGAPYLVMELLEGKTLDELRRSSDGGTLPVNEAVGYVEQLLSVLESAHKNGIVHRDIKPDNVFVTTDGKVKVLDFGIARMVTSSSVSATRTGNVMGTPAFLPPEQALGLVKQIDGRTDLWAVGALLFTLLSGRYVHEGETAEHMMVLTASTAARSLSVVCPNLPSRLVAVVDRALAFDKKDRFADSAAMLAALRAFRAGATGLAMDETLPMTEPLPSAPAAQDARVALAVELRESSSAAVEATGGPVASTRASGTTKGRGWLFGVAASVLFGAGLAVVFRVGAGSGRQESAQPSVPALPSHSAFGASSGQAAVELIPLLPSSVVLADAGTSAPMPLAAASGTTRRPVLGVPLQPRQQTSVTPTSPVVPSKVSCDPPFFVDPQTGARKVKPGC